MSFTEEQANALAVELGLGIGNLVKSLKKGFPVLEHSLILSFIITQSVAVLYNGMADKEEANSIILSSVSEGRTLPCLSLPDDGRFDQGEKG